MKGCKVARYHRPSHVHNRMPYLVSPQVIPGSPNPSRIASPTSCCLVTRSPLSVPPSYRPAGDWVPLGAPVRRWTSTGWGGGRRHEGSEGGHGLADGLDRQVLGVGPHVVGPRPPTTGSAHHHHGTTATAAPPPQLPRSRLRLRVAHGLVPPDR